MLKLNEIVLGDSLELAREIPDESIDFIFTDPPYIKKDVHLYGWLAQEAARVLKPHGLLMCYAGQYHLHSIMQMLGQHLTYYWQYISLNTGDAGIVMVRRTGCFYKPILAYSKGTRFNTGKIVFDVFSGVKDKRYHKWGQSGEEARYYIESFTQPGDTLWEPFTGGGTIPYVCKQLGRNFYASEIDTVAYGIATTRLETVQMPLFSHVEIPTLF